MTNSPANSQFTHLKRRIDDSLGTLKSGRNRSVAILHPETADAASVESSGADLHPGLILPGAFNPLHDGHLQMARFAESQTGEPAWFELSIQNVDKPDSNLQSIRHRLLESMTGARISGKYARKGHSFRPHGVLVTNLGTFEQKSTIFPGCIFAVGIDTLVRVFDLRYYGQCEKRRDEALQNIADLNCRFLVFGRALAHRFVGLFDFTIPKRLLTICDQVPESQFRCDVSSSKIRKR